MRAGLVLGLLLHVGVVPEPALATDATQACVARKLQACGKRTSGQLKCAGKDVRTPGAYAACAAAIVGRFVRTFAEADARGGCAPTGDADAMAAKIEGFVDTVVGALTGDPRGAALGTADAEACAVRKLKSTAKLALRLFKCHQRATTAGLPDPSCVAKAHSRHAEQWTNAEAAGGCATTNDGATVVGATDAFVDDVAEELQDLIGTLFVTVQGADKLYALDAATGAILASADTQQKPVGVEYANGKVYVANEGSGTVSVYDARTLSPLAVIPVCAEPHHTAILGGAWMLAACLSGNQIAVVDVSSDGLLFLMTSGAPGARTHQPWAPKGVNQGVWAANWGTNDITEISLDTFEIVRVLPMPATPVEVVVPSDGRTAYVSVPELGKLLAFDLDTNELVAERTLLAPENLSLSADDTTILSSWAGLHSPTAVTIVKTADLTSVDVPLPAAVVTHTDMSRHAQFGFAAVAGPNAVAVVDLDAAQVRGVYPMPGDGLMHGLRYAPGFH